MADFNQFIKGFEEKKPETKMEQPKPTNPKVEPKPVEPNFDDIIQKHFGAGFKKSSYDPHTWESEDGEEYWVGTDREATLATREDIKSYYNDEGIQGFTPDFQEWALTNAVDHNFLKQVQDEEVEYYKGEGEEENAQYLEKMDTYDFLEYLKDNLGEEYVSDLIKKNNAIDVDALADEAISWDGRGHFLSGYDGKEIELPNGLFAYRRN